jgi:hypothetical protein
VAISLYPLSKSTTEESELEANEDGENQDTTEDVNLSSTKRYSRKKTSTTEGLIASDDEETSEVTKKPPKKTSKRKRVTTPITSSVDNDDSSSRELRSGKKRHPTTTPVQTVTPLKSKGANNKDLIEKDDEFLESIMARRFPVGGPLPPHLATTRPRVVIKVWEGNRAGGGDRFITKPKGPKDLKDLEESEEKLDEYGMKLLEALLKKKGNMKKLFEGEQPMSVMSSSQTTDMNECKKKVQIWDMETF